VLSGLIKLLKRPSATYKCLVQVIGITALALGLISVGTCSGEVTSSLLQTLIERSEVELKDTHARYIALALALVYLGKAKLCTAAHAISLSWMFYPY